MARLPQTGLELVVKNARKATRDLKRFDKEVKGVNKTVQSKAPRNFFSRFSGGANKIQEALDVVTDFSPALGNMTGQLSGATQGLSAFATGAGGATLALGALAAGIAVVGAAFVKLGFEGDKVQSTANAFGNSIASIGDPNGVMANLREQTRGAISDLELMQLTIKSLQGTTTEFRNIVAPNLGRIFDVTTRAAEATGQSAEIVREKFLLGLRRQSNLLLDDIGITVDATKAQEAYAKQLGITASQLTDTQKQAAFAQAAISQLDDISEEAGGIGSLTELIARARTAFANFRQQLALALQPAFQPLAQGLAKAIASIGKVLQEFVIPVIATLVRFLVNLLKPAFAIVANVARVFGKIIGSAVVPILVNLIAIVSLVLDAIGALFSAIADFINKIFGPVNKEVDKFSKDTTTTINDFIENAAERLGFGGAFIIGAFAAGIAKGATQVVKAVTFIANIVADFLQGLSPPKKGPLSKIDIGGEKVIEAWASGMLGIVKQPISEVAMFVEQQLGAIAGFSVEQVQARLARLDVAIQPFKEQLEIVRSEFEAIAGFTDPALRILERQRKAALDALRAGGGDIETLRALDRQVAQIKELNEARQNSVDLAEFQLGLAQATQAKERALLNIQLQRLGAGGGVGADIGTGGTGAGGAGAGSAGGGGISTTGDDLTDGLLTGDAPDLFDEGVISETKARLKAAFERGVSDGLSASGVDDAISGLAGERGKLSTALGRIAGSKPGQGISKALDGVFGPNGTIAKGLEFFSKLFSDPSGTFQAALNTGLNFVTGTIVPQMTSTFLRLFGASGVLLNYVQLFTTIFTTKITSLWSEKLQPAFTSFKDSLLELWQSIFSISDGLLLSKVKTLFDFMKIFIQTAWSRTFSPAFEMFKTSLGDFWRSIFGLGDEYLLFGGFKLLFTLLGNFVRSMWDEIFQAPFDTFKTVWTEFWNGLAQPIIDIQNAIMDIPNTIADAFDLDVDAGAGFGSIASGAAAQLSSVFSGQQSGTHWTGSGPVNRIAGFHHMQEAVVPAGGMQVKPSPSGLRLTGLLDASAILRDVMSANIPAMSPASVQNNVDNSRQTNVGGVNISVNTPREAIRMKRQMLAMYGGLS